MAELPSESNDTLTQGDISLERSRRHSVSEKKPTIAGYQLGELLGKGAYGRAYKAQQEGTGQNVAVKVLDVVSKGFRSELARLSEVSDHRHVVSLTDANLDADPPYLVTPYLSGSLREEISANTKADIPQVVTWFEEVAQALHFIHSRGILHGDLKPSNILLDDERRARIVDFGQAVSLGEAEVRLGSFWHMPWQQARRSPSEVRLPQSSWDIYALGATIYRLLTGKLPRATPEAQKKLTELSDPLEKLALYRQIVQESKLTKVRTLNPRVDKELAAIVETCLQEGPQEYSSASELLDDLARRQNKQTLRAKPWSLAYALERFYARNRVAVVAASLIAGLSLTALGAASFEVYRARQARQLLVTQQYERGLSLLSQGRASGLVWLEKAYAGHPDHDYRQALQSQLSSQLRIADPKLYRLRTLTAPSPSGAFAIWRKSAQEERVLLNLLNGETTALPPEILQGHLNQKDNLRYRLDGLILDPYKGSGGSASWRLPPSDSVAPGAQDPVLAILLHPEGPLHIKRIPRGFGVFDRKSSQKLALTHPSLSTSAPTFSLQGDVLVAWGQEVQLHQRDPDKGTWELTRLDTEFQGELFCFSPDASKIAGQDADSKVRIWNRQGDILAEFELGAAANEMCFDKEGELLVCVTRDGLIQGYDLLQGKPAWAPAEMEKAARWVFVQNSGRIVTFSDELTVWEAPKDNKPIDTTALSDEVARRTGWVYDGNAQVRSLSREEYLKLFVTNL